MLSDLASFKTFLRKSIDDTSEIPYLQNLLVAADRSVKLFCKQSLETQVISAEYRTGGGVQDLYLYQRPVLCYNFTGTLTSGSPYITNLTSANPSITLGSLIAGMPIVVAQANSSAVTALPNAVTVASVNATGSQVILSAAATATATGVTFTDTTASLTFTGDTTAGSPVLVNVSSLTGLAAGDSVTGSGIPDGTTLVATTAGLVTMSASATQSLTNQPLTFGLAVWFDPGGLFGDGIVAGSQGPFAQETQLYIGQDYSLLRDRPDGTSKSGVLRRIRGGIFGGGTAGFFDYGMWGLGRGTLTAPLAPVWPKNLPGSIKVSYACGYGFGAPVGGPLPANTTIPPELTYCVNAIAAWIRVLVPVGVPVELDSVSQEAANILNLKTVDDPEIATVRGILRRYRAGPMF